MKKFYIMAILAMAAVPATAQGRFLHGFASEDGIERCVYVYNELNKVSEIRRFDIREPEFNYIAVVSYDENGYEVRSDLYQDMHVIGTEDYHDYVHTAYIELKNNDKGQVIERQNYNNWGASTGTEDWERGGIMTYEYDDAGNVVSEKTYFSEEDLFQERKYTYSADGKLLEIQVERKDFFMGDMSVQEKCIFLYNEDGQLEKREDYSHDMWTDDFLLFSAEGYEYKSNGNLLSVSSLSASGNVQRKNEYFYDSSDNIPIDQMILPYEFEESENNSLYSMFREMPLGWDFYAINDETGQLTTMATYIYDFDSDLGVDRIAKDRHIPVGVLSLSGGMLVLSGVQEGQSVKVYGTDGRLAADVRYNGNLDLSGLARGTYMVVTPAGTVKVKN